MSINLVNLAGPIVGRVNYQPAGSQTKTGKTMSFARMSCRLKLPDDKVVLNGNTYPLAGQEVWLNLDVPKQRGGQVTDEGKVQSFIQAVESGRVYAVVTEAKITSWQAQDGPRYEVKCNMHNIRLDAHQGKPSNMAIIAGTLASQGQGWAQVEERYHFKDEWKSRLIQVLVGGDLPASQGSNILVYGRLASKTWDNKPFVHVVAKEIL